jgi:hypothetical protein
MIGKYETSHRRDLCQVVEYGELERDVLELLVERRARPRGNIKAHASRKAPRE